MSIDWSKAPEGATHYRAPSRMYCDGFYRRESNGDWFFFVGSSWEFIESPDKSEAYTLIARPTKLAEPEWVDGFPPVGCECKVWFHSAGVGYWEKGTCVAIDGNKAVIKVGATYYGRMRDLIKPVYTKSESDEHDLIDLIKGKNFPTADNLAKAIIAAGWVKED